jgi:hypothetical protein
LKHIFIINGAKEYIIELKIWHGEKKLNDGVAQISEYLDMRHQKEGWLIAFSFNKEKFENQEISINDKIIHCMVV